MKQIADKEVKNFRGGDLFIPKIGINGDVMREPLKDALGNELKDATGQVITKPMNERATVKSLLEYMIMSYPQSKLNMKSITECMRLQSILDKSNGTIDIEDSTYEWLVNSLKDEKVGITAFGLNVTSLLQAIGSS